MSITATLKVYYTLGDTKCLARGGAISATKSIQLQDIATVDLRTCVAAVTNASPELIGDKSLDYSIYTLDATEGSEGELFEGQGLLSWNLARPMEPIRAVSGVLKPSLSGQIIEVRMKLAAVTATSQQDFVHSMQTYERIAKTLPATFDNTNWNEFMRHANAVVAPMQLKSTIKPQAPPIRKPITNTLQKAREMAARKHTQGMSAQLHAARQQQITSQMHAHRIAQQAVNQTNLAAQQKRSGSQEGEGPIPEGSPQLPIASSPPQMRTFTHPASRSNSMPASDPGYALPTLAKFSTTGSVEDRGMKRKAGDMQSESVFSPSKATNAARNKFGEVQQLFKGAGLERPTVLDKLQQIREAGMSQASTPRSTPKDPSPTNRKVRTAGTQAEKNDKDLLDALKEGKPIKYCYNCGTIQTKGNWRALVVDDEKQNLCNACGVYYKNKKMMRPPNLWKPMVHKPEPVKGPLTSPISKDDFKQRARAVQSSPAMASKRSLPAKVTPEKRSDVLHEIHTNTPPGPTSPSPASGGNLDDLFALLQTPKKSFSSKMLSSPSPWRSMFTTLPESPAKMKIDKFMEDFCLANGQYDLSSFALSPGTENLANFMSSPPSLGLFTSSAGGEENLTPDDELQTSQTMILGSPGEHQFGEGDSLFTPRKPTTRSDTNSAQRNLRSAGKRFGESMFGVVEGLSGS